MNQAKTQEDVEIDLRRSPSQTVVYLEGDTDVKSLFALLGMSIPPGDLNKGVLSQDVLVKPCGGSTAVRAHVDVASSFRHPGRVLGIMDGDGLPFGILATKFDAPYSGPLFFWKAYCIENLLAKTGWPSVWGEEPDWRAIFLGYGPYVILNRIHSKLISALKALNIAQFTKPPKNDEPLRTDVEILAALDEGKHLIRDFDVAAHFRSELLHFQQTVDRDIDEVHALLDGKWLVEHLAHSKTRFSIERCRNDWIAHAISVGGLAEVREWWERVIGSTP